MKNTMDMTILNYIARSYNIGMQTLILSSLKISKLTNLINQKFINANLYLLEGYVEYDNPISNFGSN